VTPEERDAFVLGAVQGLGRIEMGQVLEVSPNTAYSRLARARKKFKVQVLDADARRPVAARSLPLPLLVLLHPRDTLTPFVAGVKNWFLGASAAVKFATTFALGAAPLTVAAHAGGLEAPTEVRPQPVRDHVRAASAGVATSTATPPGSTAPMTQQEPVTATTVQVPTTPPRPAVPSTTPATRTATSTAARGISALEDEVQLIKRAQRAASSGQNDTALRLLETHAKRYPAGRLAIDRRFLHATVVCEASSSYAATVVGEFLDRYPNHPQAQMLVEDCRSALD
jgi:hypothetical protein